MSTTSAAPELGAQLAAEAIGTMFLVAGVVGSGIMAQTLTHDAALALLCNALATGALLIVLILMFAPVSGAQFNPAVTLALYSRREIDAPRALGFVVAQIAGAACGTFLAHAMFALPVLALGEKVRTGPGQWMGEGVATFGLLLTIFGCRAGGARVVAVAVGLYIMAAYWFTSSTSFANPAVTLARALTPTFAGIRPLDVPPFVAVQCVAAVAAALAARWLFAQSPANPG
ncbi:MAG TPA: MIP/aquaporin family protein [Rhizomicrobium sp.]|nr:MIP/aquaporin family protein [Rhizomicrobium sp.]